MGDKYKKLDISLLDAPPELRAVAHQLRDQFPPPSLWQRIARWFRGFRS